MVSARGRGRGRGRGRDLRTARGDSAAHSCPRPGSGGGDARPRSAPPSAQAAGRVRSGETRPGPGWRNLPVGARSLTEPDPCSHSPDGHGCQLTRRRGEPGPPEGGKGARSTGEAHAAGWGGACRATRAADSQRDVSPGPSLGERSVSGNRWLGPEPHGARWPRSTLCVVGVCVRPGTAAPWLRHLEKIYSVVRASDFSGNVKCI